MGLVALLFLAQPVKALAPIVPPEPPLETKEEMVAYTLKRAKVSGVSPDVALAVISCESSWDPNALGDSGQSHGLVQIHAPSHPSISPSESTDPRFAIDFLVSALARGEGNMWTCYRSLKNHQ